MVPRGGRRAGMRVGGEEFGISSIDSHLCICIYVHIEIDKQQDPNTCSIGSYVRYLVIAYNRKESEKEYIYFLDPLTSFFFCRGGCGVGWITPCLVRSHLALASSVKVCSWGILFSSSCMSENIFTRLIILWTSRLKIVCPQNFEDIVPSSIILAT